MLKNLKQFNLPEIEEKVLKFWKENQVFEKSVIFRQGRGKKRFVFFEGPPTANGRPGIHHVLSRVFKDVVLRYKTMRGFYVPRRAGWDTHGLPVEIGVEKELGLKNKQDIEKFGIVEFNAKARESVWRYKEEWEKLTERIGFWLDLKNPYVTYENDYIEKLWGLFRKINARGLLKQSYKVLPYCPRCQTALSSHELGQPGVYKKTKDPSIYVRFKIKGLRSKTLEYLLVWTTTPWTLPANMAIAVNPALIYTKYAVKQQATNNKQQVEYIWSYSVPPAVEDAEIEVVEKISGKKLIGLSYEPLYKPDSSYKVLGADFVSMEEGTGLVHIAPAFGEEDLNLVNSQLSIPDFQISVTIDDSGKVIGDYPGRGKFIKEADKDIVADLERRGLLWKKDIIEHDYPFCWRCGTLLIYFARLSWFIEMSRLRRELVRENKKINWMPPHLKEGRFGEWLREVKDWAISRDRYWGTPLPIWVCGRGHTEVIGGLSDLDRFRWSKNKIFMMRHGLAEHNVAKEELIASGPKGITSRLTEEGRKQVAIAAKKLKNIDVIFASPYLRARESAEIIVKEKGGKIKIIIDDRLKELDTGIFNWRPVKEHKTFFSSPIEEFLKRPPEGEHLNDVKKRTSAFLRDINRATDNKNVLVIGHGDPLWVMEGAARHLSPEENLKLSYPGFAEIREVPFDNFPYNANGDIDLHRPFIDEVFLRCPKCDEKMSRVKEVADVWFDSGAMPFAANYYPDIYPADYICEAVDQTRGWFYTLLASAVLLKKSVPYRNVISLGHILDKYGQKMSKSKGNTVDPWLVIEKYGVDVLRWHFYTVNPPGEPKKFDEAELGKTYRRFIALLYNSFVFYDTYAKKTLNPKLYTSNPNILDRWILARLNETFSEAEKFMDKYEIGEAARVLESFADDLSRWYIRRSRRRFQHPNNQEDYEAASAVLWRVLFEFSKALAPFIPFFAEALYKSLSDKRQETSVHLEDWPKTSKSLKLKAKSLLEQMEEIRRLASLALSKREEAGIKIRQPLALLRIKNDELGIKSDKKFLEILKDEINVKEIVFDSSISDEIELDIKITQELKQEGLVRELVRAAQGLRHDAGLKSKDVVFLMAVLPEEFKRAVESRRADILKGVNAKDIQFGKSEKFDAEISTKINGQEIWLGLRKL